MTTQPQLWGMANTCTKQGELFTESTVDQPCTVCGRLQVMTDGGFITCPRGCLKLAPEPKQPADTNQGELFNGLS